MTDPSTNVGHPILLPYLAPDDATAIGSLGHTFLWIAFVGLFLPALYMFNQALGQQDGRRYFHYVSALICFIASVAYLVMATGNGSLYVYGHDATYRQFLFARYIDWVFTTPLQLLDLAGLAGASSETTFILITLDVLMIISGLIGALVGGYQTSCWAFWAFGMLFFLPIIYILGSQLPHSSASSSAAAIYNTVSKLTIVSWSAYPLVWILAEGTGIISADVECILYTFLDIVAKSVFGLLICGARDGLDGALTKRNQALLSNA